MLITVYKDMNLAKQYNKKEMSLKFNLNTSPFTIKLLS